MSSIQLPNLFLLVGVLYRLLGNRIWPVKGVRLRCNAVKSKNCYRNKNVKLRLYSLSFDIYRIYIIQCDRKENK